MDVHQWKLDELRKRASRSDVGLIETRLIEDAKTIKRLHDQADRVLLDVPCSGLGVLRRHPDSKWKISPEELDRLVQLQREILVEYSRMVKKGGVLVYATCSIFSRENEDQVKWFLAQTEGAFTLDVEQRFYMARMSRK
jgi:16S rRNA (cytosine967-C5)-methyltransferase